MSTVFLVFRTLEGELRPWAAAAGDKFPQAGRAGTAEVDILAEVDIPGRLLWCAVPPSDIPQVGVLRPHCLAVEIKA